MSEYRRVPGIRPSSATCGSPHAEEQQRGRTPRRHAVQDPEQQHAANAIIATTNSSGSGPQPPHLGDLTRPLTATSTMAASTTSGRLRSRPVRNSRHSAMVVGCEHECQWRLCAGFVVDRGLRQPSRYRIRLNSAAPRLAAPRPRNSCRGSTSSPFFCASVRAADTLFHVGEKEAGQRERHDAVHVARSQRRPCKSGRPAAARLRS